MKKLVSLALSAVMACGVTAALAGCGEEKSSFEKVNKADLKVGLITLHDTSSTYDKNFIDAMYEAAENKGLTKEQVLLVTGVGETEACYNAAKNLASQGCQAIFADSFGHEDFMIQAAQNIVLGEKNLSLIHI